jgi:protein associated with RNAse G/E
MKIISNRFDGSWHRTWLDAKPIRGEPWMVFNPPGAPVHEATGKCWSSPYPVCAFFWPNRYYQVFMLLKETSTDYYCNVITPPVFDAVQNAIVFVDLDIDVVVRDGDVQTVDEDEFQARKDAYSTKWIEGALRGVKELYDMAKREQGPFSPAAKQKWREWAQNSCLQVGERSLHA